MTKEKMLLEALTAIKARIQGEYDNPALLAYGALTCDSADDVLTIADTALKIWTKTKIK